MTYPSVNQNTVKQPSTMHNGAKSSKVTHGTSATRRRGNSLFVYRIFLIVLVCLTVGALTFVGYRSVSVLERTPAELIRAPQVADVIPNHVQRESGSQTVDQTEEKTERGLETAREPPTVARREKTGVTVTPEIRSKVAHLVESSDAKTLRGLLASVRSAIENSQEPKYLRVYILSSPEDHYDIAKSVDCMMNRYNHTRTRKPLGESIFGYFVIPFNIYEFNPQWQIAYRERADMPNMSSPLNFARMYMHKLLRDKKRIPEPLPEKVVYLDTDTIVHGNINELYHQTLRSTSYPIAMALRNTKMISLRQYGINFDHPDVREWNRLYAGTSKVVNPDTPAYNNGVCVHHLLRWAEQNITENIEHWLVANTRRKLYNYGYNAPMLMGVGGRVENISDTWNFASLGWNPRLRTQDMRKGKIVHWTGKRKGWDANNGLHTHIWSPYSSNTCISNTTGRAN